MSKEVTIRFTLNGDEVEALAKPNTTLSDFLRYTLRLTGTKNGCGRGECGACSVLMNGRVVNGCLVLVSQANGQEITTIEGLGDGGDLHPLQSTFIEKSAGQCGFCTPGMILSAQGLLNENPTPSEEEIRRGISGNLCRCSGYQKITEAILAASTRIRR
jgi:carbon-monoxide dehydrogenase small subunit